MDKDNKNTLERLRRFLASELFESASWLAGGGVIKAAVAFLANLALVRLLSPEAFGQFAIIRADVSIVGALLNFRTGPLLLQAPEEELKSENLSRYTGALIAETILVGAGALVTLWLLELLTVGAIVFLITSLATTWISTELKLYERNFEYKNITVFESAGHIFSQVAAVLGAYFGLGALVLYLRNAIRQTTILEGLRRVGGLRRLPIRWLTLDDWHKYFQRLKGFWTDGLLERLYDRTVVMLVGGIAGQEVTGYFYQARRLAITPNQILRPITYRMAFNYFSHRVSVNRQYQSLVRGVVGGGVGLFMVGMAVFALADPVVPWLLGAGWEPVVPMLRAMTGVIVGMPLFATIQAYFMSQNKLKPFLLWGRTGQYLPILSVAAVVLVVPVNAGIYLSIGLSASFAVGVAAAWGAAHYQDRTLRDSNLET
ncbi:O-antigen/teichoic acid export membrane protein [Salinibacter ruber]|uniref:oligosaccharide flippase family protein n=1 Tax=Salinibacter ruber TaxID=146919 RepID=UPI0021681D9E|nr:oligosaccharide flippase family protein [Salinibacter ruber]MCS3861655.1 O-antigen/teichoic acid export membrane protein [Salinibacter ruber]